VDQSPTRIEHLGIGSLLDMPSSGVRHLIRRFLKNENENATTLKKKYMTFGLDPQVHRSLSLRSPERKKKTFKDLGSERTTLALNLACRLLKGVPNSKNLPMSTATGPLNLEEYSPGGYEISGRLPTTDLALCKKQKETKPRARKPKSEGKEGETPKETKLVNIYGDSPPPWLRIPYNQRNIYGLISKGLTFDENGRCTNASRILRNPTILKLAYESIRANPGNSTRGSDSELLDGIPRS
jgi:hypothetical protein